ncbi:hypothetical protein NL108_017143 [Boleophthalmus pectinirostris]|uniref:zinc finger MYM-type protein 2 n=1 Tax=Boleophthalmus pectinirostris TaxID=150288 RepID=UPI000A1C7669|nr:zinc finger MYM-type protein 2 [Boleophthalmus pectinirostris]KAJ0070641.1 hypothetical protein NL108_017143 [Boleophthalmus pectinirostris]
MDGELDPSAAKEDASSPAPDTKEESPMEENDDDDVVLVEEETQDRPSPEPPMDPPCEAPSPPVSALGSAAAEPIVIDDEEESQHKSPSTRKTPPCGASPAALTEPDSEIRIASVTTLGSGGMKGGSSPSHAESQTEEQDMALRITSVTSLQDGASDKAVEVDHREENGLHISNAFSVDLDPPGGELGPQEELVHNGDSGPNSTDLWLSQSASVQQSEKQSGVEPTAKPQSQPTCSPTAPARTVKVTCANCKKPLKKGQTAYQRKGSTHLFCSTTCLSAFSHKPAPKKSCTMCKKDITNMKGTIVAQVDSSESFQEFCSTGCLGAYENKQNPPKSGVKTKCTVCGKLTEIRHEVSFKTVTHRICSDTCFNVYRRANGLIMNCCEQCGDYLPSRTSANHFLLVDGQQKRFCCHNCIRDFKQAHNKLASCVTCKTLIKTGEVLHSIVANGTMGSYCSITCMNKGKTAPASFQNCDAREPVCHFCKRNALPQYQATLPEGNVLSFCSSQCVTKFQNTTLQSSTNGQTAPSVDSAVQLKCNYCRGSFSLKPEVLEWEDKVYQFCSKTCCDDYKKLHCIVTFCEFCQEERTLHETVKFSGVKRPFCSEGCKLLYKQDFIKRLGLKCVSCNHCSQMCKRGVTQTLGGMTRDFCSDTCAQKFQEWYKKAARCDCCKVQGALTETVMWRSEVKQFCDQQCLLRFYLQQNEPIMETQKGPENSSTGLDVHSAKLGLVSTGSVGFGGLLRDVKNKAVLCKPLTLTKATYCKPHMQSKPLQTDVDDGLKREYVPVPIPVPVFVPMPMNMYSQLTPAPLSLPLPVPVPVFLPTSLQGAEQIIQILRDPQTASEESKPDVKQEQEECDTEQCEADLDLESDLCPDACPGVGSSDLQESTDSSTLAVEEHQVGPSLLPQPTKLGSKKRVVEGCAPRSRLPLKSRYGLSAWRRWAQATSNQSADTKDSKAECCSRSNLLELSSEQMNVALCSFVKEVCRPNGERYSPDSILYLCLGLQQHLHSKGRADDLFGDPCYQPFVEELSQVLRRWQPHVLPDGSTWGCVDEQALWSSRLLGAHSPASLLRSLLYLNTKYLGACSVEQHLKLSFSRIYAETQVQSKSESQSSPSPYVPSASQDPHGQSQSKKRKLEEEGSELLGRVTEHEWGIYQIYRDKCPVSVRDSLDVLYLLPDPQATPEGLWFSMSPLQVPALDNLLTTVLVVQELHMESSQRKDRALQEDRSQPTDGE